MHRSRFAARPAFVLAAAVFLAQGADPAAGDGDAAADARSYFLEGKFREGEAVLEKAGPGVANDPVLRVQLAEQALKSIRGKTGEERRTALEAAKRCYGIAGEANPSNGAAIVGGVAAARDIAQLDLAKNLFDAARAQATWALALGEKAAAAGMTPETKAALGEAYGLRGTVTRKVDLVDQACADFAKGAELLEQAAAGHAKESEWLASAAEIRMRQATWVHDSIPVPAEKRDDEALTAALALAKRACEAKGAADATFVLHIRALCAAHDWKLPGDFGRPFMVPLVPPVEGFNVQVPKGASWKRAEKTSEWDLILERKYDPADSAVQIMLTTNQANVPIEGTTWGMFEKSAPALYERRKRGYDDTPTDVPPEMLGEKKKGPQVWVFTLGGNVAGGKRMNKMTEWIWASPGKKDQICDLRVLDWRNSPSIEDPDIVAFVQSVIPAGLWPPGSAPPPDDPKGKKPPKKK